MAKVAVKGKGTADDPWILKTPPGTSEHKMYSDESSDPPEINLCYALLPRLHAPCLRIPYHRPMIDVKLMVTPKDQAVMHVPATSFKPTVFLRKVSL